MKNNKDSIKIISLAVIVFIFFIIFAWLILHDFNRLASSTFSKLSPGRATSSDVKEKLGNPDQIREANGKTEFLYDTEKEDFKNSVILEGDKVKSSQEHVFNNSLGVLSDYKKRYGEPDLILYDQTKDFLVWYIYLNEGLGVGGTDLNEVFELIHFEPQSKAEFMQSTAPQYGLAEEKESHMHDDEPIEEY